MKFFSNSRQLQALAPWVFLPLFISAITGLLYRLAKDLLGYSRDQVHWLMSLQGRMVWRTWRINIRIIKFC